MKLSKKILGAVLCGLIVVGGSNASLVKANAQVQWSEGVSFQTHTVGMSHFTDKWTLNLALEDGQLKLNGRTDIPLNITFDDTYHIGCHKQYEPGYYYRETTVFRPCWKANAGNTLKRVEEIVNNAHLRVGDQIFIYGENSDSSVKFYGPNLHMQPQSRISYDTNYIKPYERLDKHHTAFEITENGLEAVRVTPYI